MLIDDLLSDIGYACPCKRKSDGFSPTALGIDDQHLVTVSHHDTNRKLSTVGI